MFIQVTPGGSKLENATKEDLIKLLKRQQMMLKKNGTDNEKERTTLTSNISTLESRLETAESLVAQLRQENDDIYSSNEIITNNFKVDFQTFKTLIVIFTQKFFKLYSRNWKVKVKVIKKLLMILVHN